MRIVIDVALVIIGIHLKPGIFTPKQPLTDAEHAWQSKL